MLCTVNTLESKFTTCHKRSLALARREIKAFLMSDLSETSIINKPLSSKALTNMHLHYTRSAQSRPLSYFFIR